MQISQSHSPRYRDVHVIFPRFTGNAKWPPCMNIFFCGRKNSKIEVRNKVQVSLLKFKMATTSWSTFLNICDRKSSNLIYGGR